MRELAPGAAAVAVGTAAACAALEVTS